MEQETQTAAEITALVKTSDTSQRARYANIYLNGMPAGEVALYRAAVENKAEQAHYAHAHDGKFAKLEQAYKCRVCAKEVPYEERVRVICLEKDDENPYFAPTALTKPEKEELEQGIFLEKPVQMGLMTSDIKEVWYVLPRRYKAKKDKTKDTLNTNTIGTICAAQWQARWNGRTCFLDGTALYVLWKPEEKRERPTFPTYTKTEAIGRQIAAMKVEAVI